MKLSRERRVGPWAEYVMWPWAMTMCFLTGGLLQYGLPGKVVFVVWICLIALDPYLYSRAKWPERKQQIGSWPMSGIVAFLALGGDR